MWSNKTNIQNNIKSQHNQQIDAYDLCTSKCLQTLSTDLTLAQKSCFNRCIIKYSEALKFAVNHIKFQNIQNKNNQNDHITDHSDLTNKIKHIYQQHSVYNNTM